MGLSTHILDTAVGRPAQGVSLTLAQLLTDDHGEQWQDIGRGETDADGRCKTLLGDRPLEAATYCIRFETGDYYHAQNLTGLYPYVEIAFTIADPTQHYHIPLLLTTNGYTTYRGS